MPLHGSPPWQYVTLAEAAAITRLRAAELLALVAAGTGPARVRLSGRDRMLFRADILERWAALRPHRP